MNSYKLLGQRFEAVRHDTVPVDTPVVCVCVFSYRFSVLRALSTGQAAGTPAWQGDLK